MRVGEAHKPLRCNNHKTIVTDDLPVDGDVILYLPHSMGDTGVHSLLRPQPPAVPWSYLPVQLHARPGRKLSLPSIDGKQPPPYYLSLPCQAELQWGGEDFFLTCCFDALSVPLQQLGVLG